MPGRNFDERASEYVPGYDWIPGRFGPPPGIPKDTKEKFDKMSDKEYLCAFLKLSQEEKESLMVSEAERRKTFAAHWPIETIVKANDCAKEGFYYTGVADRVQCAFCSGSVRNWERGAVPKFQHKNYFNYCKMVQAKRCHNIPIGNGGMAEQLMINQLSLPVGGNNTSGPLAVDNLIINGCIAKDPALRVFSKRKQTYRGYSESNPVKADELCEAGFLYEGIGDKVKCFWCDGAVHTWESGDNPWTEHAKWYPGCNFLQQTKGLDFIRQARAEMSSDEVEIAESWAYNKGDVSFLDGEVDDLSVGGAAAQVVPHAPSAGIVNELVKKKGELTEDESNQFVSRLVGCRACHEPVRINTVLLPCKDMCVCELCGAEEKRPSNCPLCEAEVLASLRVHFE